MRPQTEQLRSLRTTRFLALAASAAGHLILFLLFVGAGSNGGELFSGEGLGDSQAIEVSLIPGRSEAVSPQAPVADPAAELLARLGSSAGQNITTLKSAAPPPPPSPERASLDELLNETARSPKGAVDGWLDGGVEQGRQGVKDGSGRQQGAAQRAQGGAAGRGGLWSVIEPCWRRQRVPLDAHARLVVDLDLLGRLVSPPQVLRTQEMKLDREQMLAEARAFDALTACLPAARGRFSGAHVLDFRRG